MNGFEKLKNFWNVFYSCDTCMEYAGNDPGFATVKATSEHGGSQMGKNCFVHQACLGLNQLHNSSFHVQSAVS